LRKRKEGKQDNLITASFELVVKEERLTRQEKTGKRGPGGRGDWAGKHVSQL